MSDFFSVKERVLAKISPYERRDHLGTIVDKDENTFTVQLDEDNSLHILIEDDLLPVREEFRTDPSSCNYMLDCKNCGWGGSSHVPFAPHYCREKVTKKSLMEHNEQPVPTNAVFEAHVIIPLTKFRPDGTKVSKSYVEAMKNFDPSVFKSRK